MAEIAAKSSALPRTKVAFLEWVDPIYCGGHWVPQMLEWAGAADVNSNDGTDSVRISWERVMEWAPEVIVIAPCGFKVDKALEQAKLIMERPGYDDLPAVKSGRVFAVDANSYYARYVGYYLPIYVLSFLSKLANDLIHTQAWTPCSGWCRAIGSFSSP